MQKWNGMSEDIRTRYTHSLYRHMGWVNTCDATFGVYHETGVFSAISDATHPQLTFLWLRFGLLGVVLDSLKEREVPVPGLADAITPEQSDKLMDLRHALFHVPIHLADKRLAGFLKDGMLLQAVIDAEDRIRDWINSRLPNSHQL